MKKIFYISIILICFQSCLTTKRAQRQISNIKEKQEKVYVTSCVMDFPVKEKIIEREKLIKGDEIVIKDTIKIDCDSVVNSNSKSKIVRVPYENTTRIDILLREKQTWQESTAKIKLLNLKIDSIKKDHEEKQNVLNKKNSDLKKDLQKTVQKLTETKESRNNWKNIAIALISISAIVFGVRFKVWKIFI